MLLDGSQVNLFIAFIGGVLTFFASCLFPLVPIYLAYLSGIAVTKNPSNIKTKIFKRAIFVNGLLFTVGFIFVFVILGATVNTIGGLLVIYKPLIQKIGGLFFIAMGFFMLGIIKSNFLYKERKFNVPENITKWKKVNSFLVGVTFGFAWTPCVGPILAVILFWASQAQNFIQGTSLLLVYGIGIGFPFLIVALFFESLSTKLSKGTKLGSLLQKISAVIIIFVGFLLFFNKINFISASFLRLSQRFLGG